MVIINWAAEIERYKLALSADILEKTRCCSRSCCRLLEWRGALVREVTVDCLISEMTRRHVSSICERKLYVMWWKELMSAARMTRKCSEMSNCRLLESSVIFSSSLNFQEAITLKWASYSHYGGRHDLSDEMGFMLLVVVVEHLALEAPLLRRRHQVHVHIAASECQQDFALEIVWRFIDWVRKFTIKRLSTFPIFLP